MGLSHVKAQADTQQLIGQFKEWRANRVRGEKIPTELWHQAVKLAKKYPPSHVARAIVVSQKHLERHMKSPSNNNGQVDVVRVAPVQLSDSPSKPQYRRNSLIAEITTTSGTHVRIFSDIDAEAMQALSSLISEGL